MTRLLPYRVLSTALAERAARVGDCLSTSLGVKHHDLLPQHHSCPHPFPMTAVVCTLIGKITVAKLDGVVMLKNSVRSLNYLIRPLLVGFHLHQDCGVNATRLLADLRPFWSFGPDPSLHSKSAVTCPLRPSLVFESQPSQSLKTLTGFFWNWLRGGGSLRGSDLGFQARV